jgi:hypothetical protein
MQNQNIDFVSAGLIVTFEADTGDVLHIREKIVETVDGKPGCSIKITNEECEQLREKIARDHAGRRVDAIVASPDTENYALIGPKRYLVDPMTRKLRIERDDSFDSDVPSHFPR